MAKPMLIFMPKMQFFNAAGTSPLSGGKVFTYAPGTTTKQATYPTSADAIAGTNANPNPVILDSSGRPSNSGAPIDMYTTAAFKMVAAPSTDTDPPTNAIWTEDNITTLGQLVTLTSTKTSNYTVTTSDRDALIRVDVSGGSRTIFLPAAATAGSGFNVKIKKINSSANTVTIDGSGAETIDGSATFVISANYGYCELYCDGTTWWTTKYS